MEPIWQLLNSKRHDKDWNPSLRGALRSVIINRQWPQARVHAAGWSKHDRCLFCLNATVEKDLQPQELDEKKAQEKKLGKMAMHKAGITELASEQQIQCTPCGTLAHRIWACPSIEPMRAEHMKASEVHIGAREG